MKDIVNMLLSIFLGRSRNSLKYEISVHKKNLSGLNHQLVLPGGFFLF